MQQSTVTTRPSDVRSPTGRPSPRGCDSRWLTVRADTGREDTVTRPCRRSGRPPSGATAPAPATAPAGAAADAAPTPAPTAHAASRRQRRPRQPAAEPSAASGRAPPGGRRPPPSAGRSRGRRVGPPPPRSAPGGTGARRPADPARVPESTPGRHGRRDRAGTRPRGRPRDGARRASRARPAPGPAAADPDRPVVGDEDVVPALDRLRHRHRRRRCSMVWSVLGAAGVWDSINKTVQRRRRRQDAARPSTSQNYLGTRRVLGFTMLVAVDRRRADHRDRHARRVPLQHGRRRCSAASRSPSPRTSADRVPSRSTAAVLVCGAARPMG